MLILNRPWTRQPQGVVEVDRTNPLGAFASEVYVPSISATIVRGYQTSRISTATVIPTLQGLALSTTASSVQGVKIADNAEDIFKGSSTATIAVLRRCVDTTARNSSIFGYGINEGAGNVDRVLCHAPYSDDTLYFDFANAASGSGRVSVAFTKTTAWETLVFVASTSGSIGREVWRNGVRIANNTSATSVRTSVTNAPFYVGSTYYATPGVTTSDAGEIALFVVSSSAWRQREIAEFARNPWQIIKPRRIYFPTAAAAAGVPNLSASTYVPGSLTSTGWRPQVTAS